MTKQSPSTYYSCQSPQEMVPPRICLPRQYWLTTRRRSAAEKDQLRAFIFIFAIASPVAAACMLRIVIAVADGVGKIKRSSRAT